MMKSVAVISLNPAFDLTGQLETLTLNEVNRISSSQLHPAGKGLNVARILSNLGVAVTISGFLGRENHSPFDNLCQKEGINNQFIMVEGSTRTNIKLVAQNEQVTELNFPGFTVSPAQWTALENTVDQLMTKHDYFILTGSLPSGIDVEQQNKLIRTLTSAGKKVLFDASGDALLTGIQQTPYFVKPNLHEAEVFTQKSISNTQEAIDVLETLQQQGVELPVLSMGEQGSLWRLNDEVYQITPPQMKLVSTVGAGDSLVAATCFSLLNNDSHEQLLRFATAVSAHSVTQTGVGITDQEAIKQLMSQVTVTKLTH